MTDELDVDAPIPYVITARGLRDLQEWRDEAEFPDCPHEWALDGYELRCQNCNRAAPVPGRQNIPAYLNPRRDERKRR